MRTMGAPMHMTADKPEPEPVMVDRYTRSGRRLFYRLQVIQQPERARACGSGPKSSADRRPVDPPPVVELRIFEGPTFEESKDITFNYNANFFLYATLEHARLIAHGRVQTPAANTPPVLTGMPVSAMAYLDRPQEAGYFLFPDLSVRHEGRYRLTFTLYEETKEDKDKDKDTVDPVPFQSSFDWRMDVKSVDFTVYSAKKFPGLSESTTLSRTVAEQGCRVRIRRDVRMRRRDDKPGADGESGKDEFSRNRRRTQTPEVQREFRPRSLSNSSERTPYPSEPSRRPSGAEFSAPAGPPPPPPPPGFPSSQTSSTSHLTFGGGSFTNPPQYPSQASSSGHASPVPRSPSFAGGQSGYPPTSHVGSQPAVAPQAPAYPERPPSQQCMYPNPSPRREEIPADVRRLSTTSQVFRPNTPQSATDREFGPKSQYPTGPLQSAAPIASLEARDGPSRILPPLPPFSTFITCENNGASDVGPRPLSQLLSPASDQGHRGSISMREPIPPVPPQIAAVSRKRPHSEANPHGYYYQPESKNGKRPEESVMYQRMQERSGLLEERCLQYESADYTPRSALWQKFV